jgi:hypothetical protein
MSHIHTNNALSVINARHDASCDGYAFTAKRVADHVHLLLQPGARAHLQLRGTLPESRLFDGEQGEVNLERISCSWVIQALAIQLGESVTEGARA